MIGLKTKHKKEGCCYVRGMEHENDMHPNIKKKIITCNEKSYLTLWLYPFFLLVSDLDFFLMKKKGKNNNTNKNGDKNGRDNMH